MGTLQPQFDAHGGCVALAKASLHRFQSYHLYRQSSNLLVEVEYARQEEHDLNSYDEMLKLLAKTKADLPSREITTEENENGK